jgi:hypothetical protein
MAIHAWQDEMATPCVKDNFEWLRRAAHIEIPEISVSLARTFRGLLLPCDGNRKPFAFTAASYIISSGCLLFNWRGIMLASQKKRGFTRHRFKLPSFQIGK